jgi:hypothetical protein
MNPPINRENLRDVLIAMVVATGLAWVVGVFEGCVANTPPPLPSIIAQRVSSGEAVTLKHALMVL